DNTTHTFTYTHPIASHISEKNSRKRLRQFVIESIGVYPLNPRKTRITSGSQYDIPHNYIVSTTEFDITLRLSISYADDHGNLPITYAIEWQESNEKREVQSNLSLSAVATEFCKVGLSYSWHGRNTYLLINALYISGCW